MKVLVTGATGQLGYDVCRVLKERNIEYAGLGSKDCDITSFEAVKNTFNEVKPDAVIHCAAYTQVDAAEDNVELCRRINAGGTENIARMCAETDAKMLYISTDYVFPGDGDKFYEPDDPVGPKSVYGQTKLEGELAVKGLLKDYFIVRISWVFGENGKNFIKTMLRLSETHDTLRVVDDQIGSPTYTADLAPLLCDMIETDKYGVYHATNEGVCSWAELAEEVFRIAGKDVTVEHVTTEEYGAKAPRPKNSRMSKDKMDENGFSRMPEWKEAVRRYASGVLYER